MTLKSLISAFVFLHDPEIADFSLRFFTEAPDEGRPPRRGVSNTPHHQTAPQEANDPAAGCGRSSPAGRCFEEAYAIRPYTHPV